jgi:osmoprotectant transport system substrate-binding protein
MSTRRAQAASRATVGLAVVLTAGVLAGAAVAGRAGGGNQAHSAAAPGPKTPAGQPGVRKVPTTTQPADELPGYGKPIVVLGDENTPEQFIIGQLYALALEHQGYTVQLTRNVNPLAGIALSALRTGSLDLYPAYLDEWNARNPRVHRRFRTLAGSYRAAVSYAERQQVVLLAPTPFSDTVGIAVTSQYASQNHVSSIADLAHGTGAIFAGPLPWATDAHGLPAVEQAYHFTVAPGALQQIDNGFQYAWLRTANVDVAYAKTTDPELNGPSYKLLRDPKHVFGFGNVVPVTTQHVLDTEGPAFAQTIDRVDATLTISAMRGLNAEVELSGHGAIAVAEQFLQGHGILTPIQYAPTTTTTPAASSS